jgi:hypothetical protein
VSTTVLASWHLRSPRRTLGSASSRQRCLLQAGSQQHACTMQSLILLNVLQSCTRSAHGERARDKSYRAFLIVGTPEQRDSAQHIISSAVAHYQKLFSGEPGVLVKPRQHRQVTGMCHTQWLVLGYMPSVKWQHGHTGQYCQLCGGVQEDASAANRSSVASSSSGHHPPRARFQMQRPWWIPAPRSTATPRFLLATLVAFRACLTVLLVCAVALVLPGHEHLVACLSSVSELFWLVLL